MIAEPPPGTDVRGVGLPLLVGLAIGWFVAPHVGFEQQQQVFATALGVAFEIVMRGYLSLIKVVRHARTARARNKQLDQWLSYLTARARLSTRYVLRDEVALLEGWRAMSLLTETEFYEKVRELALAELKKETSDKP